MLASLTFYLDLVGRRGTRSTAAVEEGAVGLRLVCVLQEGSTDLDISAATTLEICLRAPSGADKTLTATFVNTGTDGKIYFDTLAGTLDELGKWKVSARVASATYDRKAPSYGLFTVVSPLCA